MLVYQIRWVYGVIGVIYQGLAFRDPVAFVSRWNFWADYVLSGLIGNSLRIAAVILALSSVYLVWRQQKPFSSISQKVALAILFEGIYYLAILPITITAILKGTAPVLMSAYIIQIPLVSLFLTLLSHKVWHYDKLTQANMLKWICISSLAYLIGIWFNNIFRWFDMAASAGISFILTGITSIGFLSTIITLSLSLVFAVTGTYFLLKKKNETFSIKLFGIALIMLALNLVIYILYSVITNSLRFMWLVEIWPIAVLGLGVGMLRGKI